MSETAHHEGFPHGTGMTPKEKHDYFAMLAAKRAARVGARADEGETASTTVETNTGNTNFMGDPYVRPLSATVAAAAISHVQPAESLRYEGVAA